MVFFDRPLQEVESVLLSDAVYGDILILLSPTATLWKQIKSGENVTATIDLLHIGLVFFDKRLSKQHFRIYY